LAYPVKLNLFLRPRPLQLAVGGSSSLAISIGLPEINLRLKASRCAKYQRMTSKLRLSH
jgi:hypothetical protein